MEFAFQEKTFSHLQLVADEWVRQEETADTIVPDSFPDAVQIVDSFATVVVRSKECRQGSVLISGGIQAGLLYLAQDEQTPRFLEAYLPFSMKKDVADCEPECSALISCKVCSIEARILNSRKLMLRVEIGCSLQVYRQHEQTFYVPGETDPRLQLHRQSYPLLLPLEAGEKLFSMEEDLELPMGHPEMSKLLHYEATAEQTEVRLAGNRAVFKGTVHLRVRYLTPQMQLQIWETTLPFSQYCEFVQHYEEENLHLQLQVTALDLQSDDADPAHRLRLALMVLAQCVVYGHQNMETVDDAYWIGGEVQAQMRPCSLRCVLDRQQMTQTVRLTVPGEVRSVQDVQVCLSKPECVVENGTARIHVPVLVHLCYCDAQGQMAQASARTQAEFEQAAGEGSFCRAAASVCGEVYAMPAPDGAEVRFELLLQCQWNAMCSLESICSLTVQESERPRGSRPSVIVCTLQRDTSVWQLAKECGTTTECICKANDLSEDTVQAGTLLLMPMA